MSNEGRLFVLSAPSGSGKTTLMHGLLVGEPQVSRSISVTTRPRRRAEANGRDYRFVTETAFERMAARGGFLEKAKILGHWYGTPRRPIERALARGQDTLLCVDVQGARQIRASGLPHTTIFVMPPSLGTLRQRLRRRGTENQQGIAARLRLARRELKEAGMFDYQVVNDRLGEALVKLRAIILAERCRVRR